MSQLLDTFSPGLAPLPWSPGTRGRRLPPCGVTSLISSRPAQQANAGGIGRRFKLVGHPDQVLGLGNAHRHAQDPAGERLDAGQRLVPPVSTMPAGSSPSYPERLISCTTMPKISSTRASMICTSSWWLTCTASSSPNGRTLKYCARVDLIRVGVAVLQLDLFGLRIGQAQHLGNIRGDVVAADRQHRRVPDIAIDIDGHIGRAAADIADHHTHLALGLVQHHFSGSQRVEHELGNFHPGGADALAQVLDAGSGGGDDVGFHFQAVAVHANRACGCHPAHRR